MTCSNSSNISFEFRDDSGTTYLKIRPRSMQFDRTRGKFDYCKAEFSQAVADELRPHLSNDGSFLNQPLSALLILDGAVVYRLLWVSDGVRFTDNGVHIEFHDPQEYLTRGTIDWRRDNVKLKEAYEYVFERRYDAGATIFNDIKFTDGSDSYEELRTQFRDGPLIFDPRDRTTQSLIDQERKEEQKNSLDAIGESEVIRRLEEENVYNIIDGHYAIDFDKITPWECITRLNNKFGVKTWAAPDGNLWVGSRQTTGYNHIATPDDTRVWKLDDYNINQTRDPVIKSTVRGRWDDDPSESRTENVFWELETLNRGTQEFRIEGVATTETNSIFGQEIVQEVDAKRDALEGIAKRNLINKQREQQSGYLDINPQFSGDSVSNLRHVAIGDSILTIPPDRDDNVSEDCKSNIETEMFDIVGVQHELTSAGNWNVRLDVTKQLDGILNPENIETKIRYYDPASKEYITESEFEESKYPFWPDFGIKEL